MGRSNSGKSSLINSLTRRKDLARISKTPGQTQQVNYFALLDRAKISDSINSSNNNNNRKKKSDSDSSSLSFRPSDAIGFFVDLPGYGYAYAPDTKVDEWQTRTIQFLMHRQELRVITRVHLLIDSRHGIMDMDRAVIMGIPELLWSIDGDFTNYVIHENNDFLENLEDRPTVL